MLAEKEKQLNEAYQQFIQFGLGNLPIEMYDTIVADNYMGYGTALDERLFSAIDLRELVMRQMEQGQGMDMTFAETPVFRRISVSEDVAIIIAEILVTILVESSRHDLFLRMTTIMEFLNGKWIAVHSHGSKPETTLGETDTWHINEWKRKNEELQKLVDEKTADLAGKNQELVIEACLERVRSQAMSMKEPADMLEICRIISEQLILLGVKEIRNVQTAIIYADKGTYLNFEYYCLHNKKIITEVDYKLHPAQEDFANQMLTGPEAFHESHFSGKELSDWVAYQSTTPQFVDSYLYTAESLNYYFYSMGPVALGVSTYAPLKPEDLPLVKRFRNVFELAYTRFLDIEQAETQAREAQIELALERVRARTMAMRHSDELKEAANLLFQQVHALGIPAWSCGYNIWDKNEKEYTGWMSTQGSIQPSFKIPLTENPTFIRQYESRQRGELFYAEEVSGQALVDHYNYMKSLPDFKPILEGFIQAGYSLPESQVNNVATFSHGNLIFITSKPVPESWEIFKRFAKVFEQTYTRFLDLQKAEAQARESQIETALERVRSHSLAMHHSEELEQVVGSLFDQLVELGLLFDGASIFLFEKGKRNIHLWVASKISTPLKVMMPYDEYIMDNQIIIDLWNANETGEDIINNSYSRRVKDEYTHYVGKYNELVIPDWIREMMLEAKSWTVSFAVGKNSLICIDSWSGQFITSENFQVVKRFARVFEQAYTRFLDLQKAEALAHEAQIEAALEKVRSASLAMHKAEELKKVVAVVFQKLKELGLTFDVAGIQLYSEGSKDIVQWVAALDLVAAPVLANLPFVEKDFRESEIIRDYWAAKEMGKSFSNKSYSFDEKNKFFEYAGKYNDFTVMPEDIREFQLKAPGYTQTLIAEKRSSVWVDSYSNQTITIEAIDILKRFARIFEQAYVRFLDLQKAETQARDAEIELALERVRARTMAMQKSEELPDAANLLFQQMQTLGMPTWSAGYCIWDEDKQGITLWMSSEGVIQPPFRAPLTEDPTFIHMRESYQRGETLHVEAVGGEELMVHYKYMRTLPVVGQILDSIIDAGHPLPTFQIMHCAYFSQGFLLFITYESVPHAWDIFKRFSTVFDQTYTRFLDLQKAEAQARERQIELALERVRARTMAMQLSSELSEVVFDLYQQIQYLGFAYGACTITLIDESTGDTDWWMAGLNNLKYPNCYHVNYFFHPGYEAILNEWKSGDSFGIIEIKGESKKLYDQILFTQTGFAKLSDDIKSLMSSFDSLTFSMAFMRYGCLSFGPNPIPEQEKYILQRFAKVFEQTYTRFLDLQKAEDQAREGQIELALERVRARTMAMQKSDELREVVAAIYEQLQHLGFTYGACSIVIMDKISGDMIWWISGFGKPYPESYHIPFFDHSFYLAQLNNWKEGTKYAVLEASGEVKMSYDEIIFSQTEFVHIPEETRKVMMAFEKINFSNAYMKHGALSWSVEPLSDEHAKILQRFAIVFEQTYTRFLDLQKAEVQARDAQIELALERIRAKTMAMQNSSELREIVAVIYDQLQHLGFTYGACAIVIMEKDTGDSIWWMAGFGNDKYPESYKVPFLDHPFYKEQLSNLHSDKSFVAISVSGEDKKSYDELIFSRSEFSRIPEETKKIMSSFDRIVFSNAYMKYGALSWGTLPISDEYAAILQRFAKVFEQTYTRFLDLQKAEAQAREARIEAALERVRSRAMAMQQSSELSTLIELVYKEMGSLDFILQRCFIMIFDPSNNSFTWWMASNEPGSSQRSYFIPYHEHKPHLAYIKGWKEQNAKWMYILKGAEKQEWDEFLFKKTELAELPPPIIQNMTGTTKAYLHSSFSHFGCICAASVEPLEGDYFEIINRFSKVFDQTYTRFLDLQNAEAQARDAQVEAALEKVRSRTMAMQKSDELADAACVLFQQLNHLGVIHERINIGIVKEETNTIDFWITEQGGNQINTRFSASLHEPTTISKVYAAWKSGKKSMIVDLTGEELKSWLKYLTEVIGIHFDPAFMHNRRLQTAGFFSKGMLVLTTPEPLPEESIHLIEKFAGVFDLTYTRFNDLLLAEAQTHKANIEVALERVRARALAMQEPEELIEVAQVLRHEMGLLGVEELETSSIYLHDDNSEKVECWYAISDLRHPEKKLVADQINIDLQKTWVGRQMFDFYQSDNTQVSILMQGGNRIEWIKYCASVSTVLGEYYGDVIPDRTYHLYKFSNGAIGAASAGDISNESWELLSRTASVFSLAYSRFKDLTKARIDLQKLKEEKQRAELALTDLKAAQALLVQSEKMASLGELTAGIAHEIQNPLNFVNNFSELSNELIEEMQEEMEKGNSEEVKNIISDIRNNLEKINLHGKRADAIVKGMLQHSRTTSGEKQPTDINALADEFLRLAYHGLRAKDKNFNATIKTEFDSSIGKVNIISQDIGRVLLNLINNAFYALSAKTSAFVDTTADKVAKADIDYEPTLFLSTRKLEDKIEIVVRDNGNGIPEQVLEKVFQPFFTTKPTGQGTGLGLSLSYDIVKAHGGNINIRNTPGAGVEFIITLPINA